MWHHQCSHGRGYIGSSHAIVVEIEPFDGQEETAYSYVPDRWDVSGSPGV